MAADLAGALSLAAAFGPDALAAAFGTDAFGATLALAAVSTGAAAAAFAGVVMEVSHPADGEHRFVIEQGYKMGRPSLIELGMTVQGGTLTRATIGGSAVIVSDGHIEA